MKFWSLALAALPLYAQAQNACIDQNPGAPVLTCVRRENLAEPSFQTVTSKFTAKKAYWAQNPASAERCPAVGQFGYEVKYSLAEVARVKGVSNPSTLPGFLGYTENRDTIGFKRPMFTGVAQFVGSGEGGDSIDTRESKANGISHARLDLSKAGTQIVGTVTSADENLTAEIESYWDCDHEPIDPYSGAE